MDPKTPDTSQQAPERMTRSPADVLKIKVLSTLLALTLLAFTFYVLATEGVIDLSPPYLSEDTPLALQTWGVTWEREYDEGYGIDEIPGLNYSSMTYSFTEYGDGWTSTTYGPLSVEYIDLETFVPPTTVEAAEAMNYMGGMGYWEDGHEIHVITCYFVSDDTDVLRFNKGDSISLARLTFVDGTLSSYGFEEDFVCDIELCWEEGYGILMAYGFAVHDGELYSWVDSGPIDDPLS